MAYVVSALLIVAAGFAGVWLAVRLGPRVTGKSLRDIPPDRQRMALLMFAVMLAVAVVVAWSFISGHPAIGIALLVIFYVLPNFVTVPIRIRRSRRLAEEARERRRAATP
jgi:hypothetical protein